MEQKKTKNANINRATQKQETKVIDFNLEKNN